MADFLTADGSNVLIDWLFCLAYSTPTSAPAPPDYIKAACYTDVAGTTECSAGAYARQTLALDVVSDGLVEPGSTVTIPIDGTETAVAVGIVAMWTTGPVEKLMWIGEITPVTGDNVVFSVGDLTFGFTHT